MPRKDALRLGDKQPRFPPPGTVFSSVAFEQSLQKKFESRSIWQRCRGFRKPALNTLRRVRLNVRKRAITASRKF